MSKRMIHSNITTSEKFSSISFEAEVLYVRLLIFTDDYGNTRGTTGFVKDICFPKDKTKPLTYKEVDKLIKELIKVELIVPYQVDNILYLHFNRFEDFQELRKDRLRKTDIPYYDCSLSIARQLPVKFQHEVEVKEEVKEKEKVQRQKKKDLPVDENKLKELGISEVHLIDFTYWLDYKKEINDFYNSYKSIQSCYKHLLKLAESDRCEVREIIDQAIARNWKGLYELKDKKPTPKPPEEPMYRKFED